MTTKILGNQITSYTIDTEQLSNTATAAFAKTLAPKILYANVASNTYTILDDAAVNVGGGYIVVTGAEFQSGAQVLIDTTLASSVTYVNSTTLRAQIPAKSAASYNLYVVNPDGGTGIKPAGITYSGSPTWQTASPLANVLSNTVFSGSFNATGATSYANTTILPTGFNLLSNGYYYGNISVGTATTYSFDIKASDDELQDSTKTFGLTTLNVPPEYTVQYLVVAGGGGGGSAGGGGAGGLLSGEFSASIGSSYTIQIGSGGVGSAGYPGTPASSGFSSNVKLSGTDIVSTNGGGFGGLFPAGTGGSGGSGGGGANANQGGIATGSPGRGVVGTQGWPGGNGIGDDNGFGGGGGAGGVGGNKTPSSPGVGFGGVGGSGYTWPYTGNTYASGGAGGSNGAVPATPGGGGASGNPTPNKAATVNTGGGGGGGYAAVGGNGGSGVVILAVPTPNYPGSAPGATVTTPPAAPGKTVLTFNSSGTYTA